MSERKNHNFDIEAVGSKKNKRREASQKIAWFNEKFI
jgi:hypothetical protein